MTQPNQRFSLHRLANPTRFAKWARMVAPIAATLGAGLLVWGMYLALFISPPDYQQGETVRIMYVHVPAAWLSMMFYAMMALCSVFWLVWKHPLADLIARNIAPIGAAFTLIVLITGALWGKPMWGAWWVWDARLTSVLILFFLYLGYIAITSVEVIDDSNRNVAAVISLLGAVNLPIIKFSVEWWNTLHQPASVLKMDGPAIDSSMMWPLMMMFAALLAISMACVLWRVLGALDAQKCRRLQLQSMKR